MDVEIGKGQSSVDVSAGDRIVIDLEETGTTGFQWVAELADDVLLLEGSETAPPASAAPGAAGRRRITLRATKPGTAQVALRLRRAWESGEAEGFDVTVNVT